MGQVMAIDYGKKRCGIAVTDDLQMIASGLPTVETDKIYAFLSRYLAENTVEEMVVGLPTDLKGNLSEVEADILVFVKEVETRFPQLKIHRLDERFTSRMASFFISQSGKSKKQKQEKGLTDKVSATLLLQNFLEKK